MNHLTKEYVTKLKDSLLFINAVVIIYNASLFLLSTKYISVHYYARDFLNKVSYITRTPQNIFFESIFLFIIIVLLMKLREKDNLKMANGLVYIEIILSFLLIIRLNGSYNGILLFVFADLLYNMRNIKHMALLLLMAFGLLLISDFNILSNIIHMPSIESYLSFYPNSSRTFMLFAKNILASLNVVVFILYLICQVLVQQEETKKISKELQLASKVNDELKTYSALSEKMAEDKERKRISREIHDTLGHALTGISAGIDACIALIDIDPQKSKEQLLVISNVVRESIKDVRRSLYKLRPGALDQRTLKDGLIKMIEEFQSVSHLNVDLYYEWENVDFENTKEDIIFRIIQETMTNALRHGHASHIEIHLFDEEEKYMIIMQDNGSGCKEIHYGYGLKQMHERVAILNGTIHFYSEEGFRTVVEIPKIGGKKMIKVMIADDQELIRQSLQIVLSTHEDLKVVDAVENGFAVLESIKKERPDVILMDIRMPEMDGVYCTKTVKEKYPDIKIIILTTFDDDEFVFSALKYGASGYLLKGVSMDELYHAICTVYNGGAMINPDIATKVFKLFSKMSMSNYAIQVDDSLSKDLTQAELKVIQQVGFGLSNKEIAQKLYLSEGTVRNYVSIVLSKLELRDRTQLAIWAVQTGVTMQEFGDDND